MTTTAQVIAIIEHCMRHRLRTPEITAASMLADLEADPIDIINISCAVEEAFGMEFEDAVMEAWASVADIVASVSAWEVVA